jgi:hypothetical protein
VLAHVGKHIDVLGRTVQIIGAATGRCALEERVGDAVLAGGALALGVGEGAAGALDSGGEARDLVVASVDLLFLGAEKKRRVGTYSAARHLAQILSGDKRKRSRKSNNGRG